MIRKENKNHTLVNVVMVQNDALKSFRSLSENPQLYQYVSFLIGLVTDFLEPAFS